MYQSHEPNDPRLDKLLDELRRTPPRDPETERRSRAQFIAEVDELFAEQPSTAARSRSRGLSAIFSFLKVPDLLLRRSPAFSAVAALIVVAALIFGGGAATVYAAQAALPGDALYGLKSNLEGLRENLTPNAAQRARLQLDFAQHRLDEIAGLIDAGRFEAVQVTSQAFQAHIQSAINLLVDVSATNPVAAQALAFEITNALSSYAAMLSDMLAASPDTIRTDLEAAITVSQAASSLTDGEVEITGIVESIESATWIVSGRTIAINSQTEIKDNIVVGDKVKVHALLNQDGTLTAREIELDDHVDDGIGNENEDGNANEDQNTNGSQNGNQNDNASEYDDDDDGADSNTNNNTDSNSNGNDDNDDGSGGNDNSNDNTNGNDNDDDGNSNDNTNDNNNSNDNVNNNDNKNDNNNDDNSSGGGNDNNNNDDGY